MLSSAEILLKDTGPSQRAKDLAQAVIDRFIPNECGMMEPQIERTYVKITDETPGLYNIEEAKAYATELFRKVDELEAGDKNVAG